MADSAEVNEFRGGGLLPLVLDQRLMGTVYADGCIPRKWWGNC